jgi:hypothetical protein
LLTLLINYFQFQFVFISPISLPILIFLKVCVVRSTETFIASFSHVFRWIFRAGSAVWRCFNCVDSSLSIKRIPLAAFLWPRVCFTSRQLDASESAWSFIFSVNAQAAFYWPNQLLKRARVVNDCARRQCQKLRAESLESKKSPAAEQENMFSILETGGRARLSLLNCLHGSGALPFRTQNQNSCAFIFGFGKIRFAFAADEKHQKF